MAYINIEDKIKWKSLIKKLIDKRIYVEIAYIDKDGSYHEGIQVNGIIRKINKDPVHLITIERADNNDFFSIPFDEKRIMEKDSSEAIEFKKMNKDIENVDFIYSWKIVLKEVGSIGQQHKGLSKIDYEDIFLGKIEELKVGDRIWLSGGYDLAEWLNGKDGYWGIVDCFIPGQGEMPAAVVKLDQKITFEDITGNIIVLELRWKGAKWGNQGVVHLELCDFLPVNKPWKERRQGKWVESHASFTKKTK